MTTKKAPQKSATEAKADEIAALMGDDTTTPSATVTPPPTVKAPETTQPAQQSPNDTPVITDPPDDADLDEEDLNDEEEEKKGEEEKADSEEEEKQTDSSPLYIVTRTLHTQDKHGKRLRFIASKMPQALGDYAVLAVKAGCATAYDRAE